MKFLFLSIFEILLISSIFSQTHVTNSIISTNTIWKESESPYLIEGNVLVQSKIRLTVEAGVEVKFDSNRVLQIDGELIARGNKNKAILFTSSKIIKQKGDWPYIFFSKTSEPAVFDQDGRYQSGSILEYCNIKYAGQWGQGSIYIESSAPYINYCNIDSSSSSGVYLYGGYSRIENCNIGNNYNKGIEYLHSLYNDLYIKNNNIFENNQGGITFMTMGSNNNSFNIEGNTIKNNSFNGGIKCGDENYEGGSGNSTYRIVGNCIYNNICNSKGGGIYIYSNNCIIAENLLKGNIANEGGGIYCGGGYNPFNYEITNNKILNDTAYDGGAIKIFLTYNHYLTSVLVSDNEIENNFATSSVIKLSGLFDFTTFKIISNNILENRGKSVFDISTFKGNILNNNIYKNRTIYSIFNRNNAGTPNVDATNNYWGTTNIDTISGQMYDFFDDGTKGIVLFNPFSQEEKDCDAPSTPLELRATVNNNSISLKWRKNFETDFLRYRIYMGIFPYPNIIIDSTNNGINDTLKTIFDLKNGVKYYFRITAIDSNYNESSFSNQTSILFNDFTEIKRENVQKINKFELCPNYPNPFNPSTTIQFSLPEKGFVELKIYSILGEEITTLVNELKDAGFYSIKWRPDGLASGIYLFQIKFNSKIQSRKMIYLK